MSRLKTKLARSHEELSIAMRGLEEQALVERDLAAKVERERAGLVDATSRACAAEEAAQVCFSVRLVHWQ